MPQLCQELLSAEFTDAALIDLYIPTLDSKQLSSFIDMLSPSLEQPRQNPIATYALAKSSMVVTTECKRTIRHLVQARFERPIRIQLQSFHFTEERPKLAISSFHVPLSLVSPKDVAMLGRLSGLPFMHLDYLGDVVPLLSTFETPEEARCVGVTADTQRFLMMTGWKGCDTDGHEYTDLQDRDRWTQSKESSYRIQLGWMPWEAEAPFGLQNQGYGYADGAYLNHNTEAGGHETYLINTMYMDGHDATVVDIMFGNQHLMV